MITRLAQFLSMLFHPLWIPTYLFAIIFRFTPSLATPINREVMPQFLLLIFVLTALIPLMTIIVMRFPYLLMTFRLWKATRTHGISYTRALLSMRSDIDKVRRHSLIQSFNMNHRAERVVPFFMISVFYVAVCVMLSGQLGWGSFFVVAMLTVAFTSFLVSAITLFWKISVHSVALSSLVGFLLAAFLIRAETPLLWPVAICIIAGGAVMTSRLYLNAHTPREVGYGSAIGFLISFAVSYWYF